MFKQRLPDMTEFVVAQLGDELKVYPTRRRFPKTPKKGAKARAKDTGRIFIGNGKKWVEVNMGLPGIEDPPKPSPVEVRDPE